MLLLCRSTPSIVHLISLIILFVPPFLTLQASALPATQATRDHLGAKSAIFSPRDAKNKLLRVKHASLQNGTVPDSTTTAAVSSSTSHKVKSRPVSIDRRDISVNTVLDRKSVV